MQKKKSPPKKKTVPAKAANTEPRSAAKAKTARASAKPAAKKKAGKAAAPASIAPGISKRFLKAKPVVKVTFRLPKAAAQGAKSASVVGDFNAWQAGATPMKRQKDGSFAASVELPAGKDYRFRYLLDGGRWENDWLADRYAPNSFGEEDSVVVC